MRSVACLVPRWTSGGRALHPPYWTARGLRRPQPRLSLAILYDARKPRRAAWPRTRRGKLRTREHRSRARAAPRRTWAACAAPTAPRARRYLPRSPPISRASASRGAPPSRLSAHRPLAAAPACVECVRRCAARCCRRSRAGRSRRATSCCGAVRRTVAHTLEHGRCAAAARRLTRPGPDADGEAYDRDYAVGVTCLDDASRERGP